MQLEFPPPPILKGRIPKLHFPNAWHSQHSECTEIWKSQWLNPHKQWHAGPKTQSVNLELDILSLFKAEWGREYRTGGLQMQSPVPVSWGLCPGRRSISFWRAGFRMEIPVATCAVR